MRYIFQKLVVIFSCCLLVLSPAGLGAMQGKNHSAHYFKQIRQLNKKSKPVLTYNQFLSQPCPIAMQTYTFAKLKDQQKAPIQEEYRGQLVPVLSGFSFNKAPWLAVLLASFLVGEVTAQNGLFAQHKILKAQKLTRIKFQQELEVLRIERLKLEQNRSETLNEAKEQQRLEKLVKIAEQKKLEDLKIIRIQEEKKIEKEKIRQLKFEQQKTEKKKLTEQNKILKQNNLKEQKELLEELKMLKEQKTEDERLEKKEIISPTEWWQLLVLRKTAQKRTERVAGIKKNLEDLKWEKAKRGPKIPFQDFNLNNTPVVIPQQKSLSQQFAVPEKTETAIDTAFIEKQHLVYYCSLLEMFTIKANTVAVLKQLVDKTATAQQILLVKCVLDNQYLLLSWFKVDEKYMGRAQELKQAILNILLTSRELSLADVLELTQQLIEYTSFIRNALFMTCEPPNFIEKEKEEALKKSSQLLARVKDISVPQNSQAAAFKMFAQDDLEKSIIMVGSDDVTAGGIAYAKHVNKLIELLFKGPLWKK